MTEFSLIVTCSFELYFFTWFQGVYGLGGSTGFDLLGGSTGSNLLNPIPVL